MFTQKCSCFDRSGFKSKKLWSDWAHTNGVLLLVMIILLISMIVVSLLFGCHSYLIVIGRTTWEHIAHSKISCLKIFKEAVNPFHERYFSNSLIIHEPRTKKISSVDDVWKSEEEITKTELNFTSIYSRNTG